VSEIQSKAGKMGDFNDETKDGTLGLYESNSTTFADIQVSLGNQLVAIKKK
jgi:hypothetical protein